ncbi:MAG: hypothetical protein ABH879_07150 [archaeon]
MNGKVNVVRAITIFLSVGILMAITASAVPTGPIAPMELTRQKVTTWPTYGPKSYLAEAGNLTELKFNSTIQTKSWQGYYGNISGVIQLDDANNKTLYSWKLAEPQGEIYAVNETVAKWSTAHCFNYSMVAQYNDTNGTCANYSGSGLCTHARFTYDGGLSYTFTPSWSNLSMVERYYNITSTDHDGIDETFNVTGNVTNNASRNRDTPHDGFFVGSTRISTGTCPAADMYENDDSSGTNFQEVLLQVNNSAAIVWTTIIENNILGNETDPAAFNGIKYDFEMIVAEDGTSDASYGQDGTMTYYFYVELE